MLTDRAEGLMRFCRVIKYAVVAVSCLATACLTATNVDFMTAIHAALLPTLMMFFAQLGCGPSWFTWSRMHFQRPFSASVGMTALDTVPVGLVLLAVWSLMPTQSGRIVPFWPCFLSAVTTLLLLNRFLPVVLSMLMFRRIRRPRILVLGPVGARQVVRRQLDPAQFVGLEIIEREAVDETGGLRLFNPEEEVTVCESKVIPIHSRIDQPGSPHAVDRVILVCRDAGNESMKLQNKIHRRCEAAGLPLAVYTLHQSTLHQFMIPISGDSLSTLPAGQEPLQNPVNQAIKRGLDILISVPFAVLALPLLCLLVRLIHRVQSPGPLFYRQERCGKNGSPFHIFKFRTMHVPKPGQTDLEDNPSPRIFQLGAILRDSRLDEIPQFLNVLAGTMSIVGPRAHHAQDRIKFSQQVPRYPMRMQVKPGITGPAQYREYCGVFRRDNVESRVVCDLEYINQWSIQSDLGLIFKTGRVIAESLMLAIVRKFEDRVTTSAPLAVPGHPVIDAVSEGDSFQKTSSQRSAA
ncbi:MAG: sugar transferase [Fuerstiella sp.]|nr:sugar transferase [Fuerstiella sp.]